MLARRKHFALLVYIAMEPGSYHARSVLCGYLWPETDDGRARTSLRVALHNIREHLGPDAVRTRDDGAVGVDPSRVTSDVARLLKAIENGNAAEVARLYRGPLLSGFHTGAAPFDRWLDEERALLERKSTDAIQKGATLGLAKGEWRHAATLAAELLRVRPTSLPALETRVEALRELGAIDRALEEVGRFRAYFEQELELPAPERVDELEEAIRAIPAGERKPAVPDPAVETPAGGGASAPVDDPPQAPPQAEDGVAAPVDDPPPTPVAKEVAPDDVPTEPGSVRSERRPVTGRRVALASGLVLVGSMIAISLVDSGGAAPSGPPASPHIPTVEARRILEEGRVLRNRGDFPAAVDVYRAAVAADSMWGDAYYEMAVVARWAGWPEVTAAALSRAEELSESMSPLERKLARALALTERGEVLAARELYLEALGDASDDVRVHMELGELEFHWGSTVGIPPAASAPRFQRVSELSTSAQAELHLARLDAMAGDSLALGERLRTVGRMEAVAELEEIRILHAVVRGEAPRAGDAGLGTIQSVAAARAPARSREAFFEEVAGGEAPERHRVLATIMRAQVALEGGRLVEAQRWLDSLSSFSDARRDEFTAAALTLPFRPPALEARSAMADRLAARSEDVLIAPTDDDLSAPAIYAPRRIFLQSLLRGSGRIAPDTAAFRRLPQQSWVDTAYINHHMRILRARSLLERDAPLEDALAALGPPSVRPGRVYTTILAYPTAHRRFLMARILDSLGRDREALDWYRTFPDVNGYDVAFLPGVLIRRGRLEARLGLTQDAHRTFRHLLALLADADPEYRAFVTEARRELARLGG